MSMTLKEARRRRFLSQRELAAQSGISRLTISLIEQGRTRPHPKTARELARALELDPNDVAWPESPEEGGASPPG